MFISLIYIQILLLYRNSFNLKSAKLKICAAARKCTAVISTAAINNSAASPPYGKSAMHCPLCGPALYMRQAIVRC